MARKASTTTRRTPAGRTRAEPARGEPKYMAIIRELRRRIRAGTYSDTVQVPPDKALAREFGVAPMTARNAVMELVREGVLSRQRGRGKGTFVIKNRGAPPLPQRPARVLRRVGLYCPDTPQRMRTRPTLLLPYLAMQEECERRGVELITLNRNEKSAVRSATYFRKKKIDALVVLEDEIPPELLAFQQKGIPVILTDTPSQPGFCSFVAPDDYQGAHAATRYLIELGHKRVGLVATRVPSRQQANRRAGWAAALDIEPDARPEWQYIAGRAKLRDKPYTFSAKVAALAALFRKRRPPKAIFARDGQNACATIKALNELGLRCPQDVSVTCINAGYEAFLDMPQMTAALCEEGLLGPTIMRLAEDIVSGRSSSPLGIGLPMRVVEGETTKRHRR